MTDSYNGWANYDTWNVALWVNNDEPMYGHMRRYRPYNAAKAKRFCRLCLGPQTKDGVRLDGPIDWQAIAEDFNEE